MSPAFIINDLAEIGLLEVNGRCAFLYKGGSIYYDTPDTPDSEVVSYRWLLSSDIMLLQPAFRRVMGDDAGSINGLDLAEKSFNTAVWLHNYQTGCLTVASNGYLFQWDRGVTLNEPIQRDGTYWLVGKREYGETFKLYDWEPTGDFTPIVRKIRAAARPLPVRLPVLLKADTLQQAAIALVLKDLLRVGQRVTVANEANGISVLLEDAMMTSGIPLAVEAMLEAAAIIDSEYPEEDERFHVAKKLRSAAANLQGA